MKKNVTNRVSALLLLSLAACGQRDSVWTSSAELDAHGLRGSAALIDAQENRVLMLPVEGDLTLSPVSIPVGKAIAASATTADKSALFVLSHGDVPRRRSTDQAPSLTVIDGGTHPRAMETYTLGDPLSGIAVDPAGAFAIVYPSADDSAFVENPNELAVVDLSKGASASNPTPVTLRSFGSSPQSFFFTPTLELPGGKTRLLVTLTDRDVSLLDLNAPELGDVTVRLGDDGSLKRPIGVAVTDGEKGVDDDARIAIQLENDDSVVVIDLAPKGDGDLGVHAWKPVPNEIFAGEPPSGIAFVRTDGGLRLAATMPASQELALIDPVTGISESIDLGMSFEHVSIVTDVTGTTDLGADVALLWSSTARAIAFVELGKTIGKPYKSVDLLSLEQPTAGVLDVPAPNDRLKLLSAPDRQSFFVLDLLARTAAPIVSSTYGAELSVGPDGRRAWIRSDDASEIASLNLDDFHPVNLELDDPAAAAFDVERRDGGRALIALHQVGAIDATVLDGMQPSLDGAVQYEDLLLGSLR